MTYLANLHMRSLVNLIRKQKPGYKESTLDSHRKRSGISSEAIDHIESPDGKATYCSIIVSTRELGAKIELPLPLQSRHLKPYHSRRCTLQRFIIRICIRNSLFWLFFRFTLQNKGESEEMGTEAV